jgi:hypothetical protein
VVAVLVMDVTSIVVGVLARSVVVVMAMIVLCIKQREASITNKKVGG